jgi:hypothetical protein
VTGVEDHLASRYPFVTSARLELVACIGAAVGDAATILAAGDDRGFTGRMGGRSRRMSRSRRGSDGPTSDSTLGAEHDFHVDNDAETIVSPSTSVAPLLDNVAGSEVTRWCRDDERRTGQSWRRNKR